MDPYVAVYGTEKVIEAYDRKLQQWRRMNMAEIPWTFTLAELPTNYREEARLWLKFFRRIKHRFIWFNKEISKVDFSKIKSRRNTKYYDRYASVAF